MKKKISIDVAIELTKIPNTINPLEVLNKLTSLTNIQKIDTLKLFKLNGHNNIDDFDTIKENIVLTHNQIILEPSYPYVFDIITNNNIRNPENMFEEIVNLIKNKKTNDI